MFFNTLKHNTCRPMPRLKTEILTAMNFVKLKYYKVIKNQAHPPPKKKAVFRLLYGLVFCG